MVRRHFISHGLLIVGLFILGRGMVEAGTVIDQEMIDIWGKRSGSFLFYSKKKLRIDQKDGKLSTIMDFKRDRIVILEHGSESYIEYRFTQWQEQVFQKAPRQKGHEKREIRIEPTGAEKEINGFETTGIRVFIDETLFQDTWVTRDVNLEDMLETMEEVSRLSGSSKADVREKEEIYRKIKEWGFPILTTEYRRYAGKTLQEITEVLSIETRRLDSSLFAPPQGYTKRTW
jgi:hypothetical protein